MDQTMNLINLEWIATPIQVIKLWIYKLVKISWCESEAPSQVNDSKQKNISKDPKNKLPCILHLLPNQDIWILDWTWNQLKN
jgi:hypothetical protein